jgi:hypothetical protein
MAGDRESAVAHYGTAAARTTIVAERDYLMAQAARLGARGGRGPIGGRDVARLA